MPDALTVAPAPMTRFGCVIGALQIIGTFIIGMTRIARATSSSPTLATAPTDTTLTLTPRS